MRKLNLLYLVNSFTIGGAETVAFAVAKGLDKSRFSVTVCAICDVDGATSQVIKDSLTSNDVGVASLHKSPHGQRITAVRRLVSLLRSGGFDIVHSHCPSPDFYGGVASFFVRRVKVFSTIHSTAGYSLSMIRILAPRMEKYVAISETVQLYMTETLRLSTQQIQLIYNGVDVPKYQSVNRSRSDILRELGVNPGYTVITNVGRVAKEKGQIYFVQMAREIIREFPKVCFLIVGDDKAHPDLSSEIQAYIESNDLSAHVVMCGVRYNIPEILSASDVFVFPSIWEGFALVTLEAMAAGVPIVATDVGSASETITDGLTGFLVQPTDVTAMVEKLLYLLRNPYERQAVARRGEKLVSEQFSLDRTVQGHSSMYLEAIGG